MPDVSIRRSIDVSSSLPPAWRRIDEAWLPWFSRRVAPTHVGMPPTVSAQCFAPAWTVALSMPRRGSPASGRESRHVNEPWTSIACVHSGPGSAPAWPRDAYAPRSCPSWAREDRHLIFEPSRVRWRWLASSNALRVCLRECGQSLRARIRQLASTGPDQRVSPGEPAGVWFC
jgi:hypothetical protein